MPVLPHVHILNGKTFSGMVWKVIVNLLNISFTEGVTASHPKHCRWNLSAEQCTGHRVCQTVELLTRIPTFWHVAAQQPRH